MHEEGVFPLKRRYCFRSAHVECVHSFIVVLRFHSLFCIFNFIHEFLEPILRVSIICISYSTSVSKEWKRTVSKEMEVNKLTINET